VTELQLHRLQMELIGEMHSTETDRRDAERDRTITCQGRSQKFMLGGYLLHDDTTVLYTSSLTTSAAISAQNNFQGLILGGYIYRYTPRRYAPVTRVFRLSSIDKPLAFWHRHEESLPILSKVAQVYLGTSSSSLNGAW